MASPSNSNQPRPEWRQTAFICLLLILLVAVLFGPLIRTGLIDVDDQEYVQTNIHVRDGFTWANVLWAFQPGYASNWHPLTWLSHMLDCQLFGLNYHWHHLVTLVFHTGNALLVFFIFKRMTGRLWPSGLVAILFAIHPLHVESVAWLSERKDVLSTFFEMLTMLIYVKYAKANIQHSTSNIQRPTFYFLSLFFFACALMSKPMVVTLPFLLLLLDWWPLKRIADCGLRMADWKWPVIEKLPFIVLSVITAKLTLIAQRKAIISILPMSLRFENAMKSYVIYLKHMIWPTDLAFYYPYAFAGPAWPVLFAIAFLVIITGLAVWMARSRPWFLFGWLWYLGAMVPVIGVVQAGSQNMADRYTYVSVLGILVILVWGANDLMRNAVGRKIALTGAVIVPVSLAILTHIQTGYWKDSITLFTRTLAVTKDNFFAYRCLGDAYVGTGDHALAAVNYEKALKLIPDEFECLDHYGNLLAREGKYEEAAACYQRALAAKPGVAKIYFDCGNVLGMLSRYPEAEEMFSQALRSDPDFLDAQINRAVIFSYDDKMEQAAADCQEVIARAPGNPRVHFFFALLLARSGQWPQAAKQYRICAKLSPQDPIVQNDLAWILAVTQDPALRNLPEAIRLAERACALTGFSDPGYLDTLAVAYAQAGRFADAVNTADKAIKILLAQNQMGIAEELHRRVLLYKAGQPYRPAVLEQEAVPLNKLLDQKHD